MAKAASSSCLGDHERRGQHEDALPSHGEVQALVERPPRHFLRGLARRHLGRSVLDKLHPHPEPEPPNIANARVPPAELAQPVERPGAEPRRAVDQSLGLENLQRGQAGASQDRVLLVRVVANGKVAGHVEVPPRDHRRQGEDAAAERLPQDDDVRHDAEVLEREEPPRLAEPVWYLVEHEQRPMGIARRSHL